MSKDNHGGEVGRVSRRHVKEFLRKLHIALRPWHFLLPWHSLWVQGTVQTNAAKAAWVKTGRTDKSTNFNKDKETWNNYYVLLNIFIVNSCSIAFLFNTEARELTQNTKISSNCYKAPTLEKMLVTWGFQVVWKESMWNIPTTNIAHILWMYKLLWG